MAYNVVKDHIPALLHGLKSPHLMKPEYITIHNTANDATARNEVAYMKRNPKSTGYHVAIDDKEAIEVIPLNRNAWHAGDGGGTGNRKSIGIEICYSKSGGPKYAQAEANTIEYTAQLLKAYGWGIDRVKWHRDWSGKNCPHRILDEGRGDAFRKAVANRLDELTKPKTEVKGVSNVAMKLTPGQQKAKDTLVKHGLMAKDYEINDPTILTLVTMLAPLVHKLESKGSI